MKYAESYREHFAMERRRGILQIRMHTGDGPALLSPHLLDAWARVWRDVGGDPDNEVVIITGTGDRWIGGVEQGAFALPFQEWSSDIAYEQYRRGIGLLENLVFAVDVPTIGALNGPGPRMETALLCDV